MAKNSVLAQCVPTVRLQGGKRGTRRRLTSIPAEGRVPGKGRRRRRNQTWM